MKRKTIIITLSLLVLMFTFACSNVNLQTTVSDADVIEETNDIEQKISIPYENIDLDVTTMTKQIADATVKRIHLVPEDYVGKIIRISGVCSTFYDEKNDIHYYTCEITDSTACCLIGIEFELSPEYKFPDDYPKEVTVVGIFDKYKEGATTYKTLRKAYMF